MTTSDSGRFPLPLTGSTVPRWSHRDPVECGNPFPQDDPRHTVWEEASARARVHAENTQMETANAPTLKGSPLSDRIGVQWPQNPTEKVAK